MDRNKKKSSVKVRLSSGLTTKRDNRQQLRQRSREMWTPIRLENQVQDRKSNNKKGGLSSDLLHDIEPCEKLQRISDKEQTR